MKNIFERDQVGVMRVKRAVPNVAFYLHAAARAMTKAAALAPPSFLKAGALLLCKCIPEAHDNRPSNAAAAAAAATAAAVSLRGGFGQASLACYSGRCNPVHAAAPPCP